jgi:ABC-type glutathione transport system ATPase component
VSDALLSATGLSRDFRTPSGTPFGRPLVRSAVRNVDLEVANGEALAIIGESGSGKSSLVRLLLALDTPSTGSVRFEGREVVAGSAKSLHWLRRETGIVLQDPYSSLDPRMTVGQTVAEPLQALSIAGDHRARVAEVLAQVGLDADTADRYPHEFSGGQRQRIALSRAIVHGPKLLVGDEPLSALDVTVRAQILHLLKTLRAELELSMILVSHDIGLVYHLCERVMVMKDGVVVESGRTADVLENPQHPYTRQLISSIPTIGVGR